MECPSRRDRTSPARLICTPETLSASIVEPAGLSVMAAAKALQVSRPTLSSLHNGKADLSGEIALRLEKAFGVMDT